MHDRQIAGIALTRRASLATRSIRHFEDGFAISGRKLTTLAHAN
jgi:predicted nucleic acid-binding protein